MDMQFTEAYVKSRLERETILWWILACETFGINSEKYPTISFIEDVAKAGSAPMKTQGGVVIEYGIQLNLELAMVSDENFIEILNQTVPHEVCHIIARMFFPMDNDHHGWAWKSVMLKMGKNPDRCTKLVMDSSRRPFEWKCQFCGQKYFVGKKKHEKMQNCRCGVCRNKLPLIFVANHEIEQDRFI